MTPFPRIGMGLCASYTNLQLRGSTFIWFHIRSSYMIYFIYIIYIHLFHENIWTHNWPAPNVSGFIAQLVRASHRYREVTGSNPVEVLNFFQASLRNCINCVHNCEDQPSFDFISAVHIWFISYTSFKLFFIVFVFKQSMAHVLKRRWLTVFLPAGSWALWSAVSATRLVTSPVSASYREHWSWCGFVCFYVGCHRHTTSKIRLSFVVIVGRIW